MTKPQILYKWPTAFIFASDVTVYVIFCIAFHSSFMLSLISERLVMKSLVFWDVARRRLVVRCRRFGALLNGGACTLSRTKNAYSETWMTSCQGTAHILLERRSHLHSGKSLKYRYNINEEWFLRQSTRRRIPEELDLQIKIVSFANAQYRHFLVSAAESPLASNGENAACLTAEKQMKFSMLTVSGRKRT